MTFKAVLVRKTDAGQTTELANLTDADLSEGDERSSAFDGRRLPAELLEWSALLVNE